MPTIRTLNLLWERRIRGAYAVSRYSLRNDGTLAVALPRPLEPRSYDLTCLSLDGGAEIYAGFAVETLAKLEVTGEADSCLGMTADDLYLFPRGEKRRFLGERQLLYVDAALSADGRHLAAAFSDRAAASYALAYGEIDGRVVWMRDMDLPVTTVALSRLGNRVVTGTESGTIQLIDSARRDVWEFGQEEPIRVLACSEDGLVVVYGTALGAVGAIDGSGTRYWEARLPGEVKALALSADGRLCAALCRPESDPGATRLFCLEETGRIAWEYDAEQHVVGLALSPDGRYLATAARNGTLAVFEVVPGEAAAARVEFALTDPLARAERLFQAGDVLGACELLQKALAADSGDVAAYELLTTLRGEWRRSVMQLVEAQCKDEDYAAAISTLEAAQRIDPWDIEIMVTVLRCRRHRGEQLLAQAQAESLDTAAAEPLLLAALNADPTLVEARHALGKIRLERVREADGEAERLLAAEDLQSAVAALERAQALAPTVERKEKLEGAYTAAEFAAGMAAYHEKRYQEAQFQFKKVLHREPNHAEAKRYLAYAQRFAQDGANDIVSDRFSFLE